jgi:uncharacterized protein (TIGR02266 family)
MAEERRSVHRVRIAGVRVTYESATGEAVEADVVDLGAGGMFVRTAAPMAVGKRVSLELHVLGEPGPWSALGRVVWTRAKGEGDAAPPGMAVKLIDADEAVIAAIERLVETRERTEPGVGKPSTPPPAVTPVVMVAPERERTLMGVGLAPEEPSVPPQRRLGDPVEPRVALEAQLPVDAVMAEPPPPPREQSVAIDLVSKKSVRPAPMVPMVPMAPMVPRSVPPPALPVEAERAGSGRVVVVLLLLIVAGVAAYVLLDGFLRPPVH